MAVDGNEVSSEIYLYWMANYAGQVESQIGTYSAYYEEYQDYLEEDGSINWDSELEDGTTINQYVRECAEDTIKLHAVIENEAEKNNIVLTEEQEQAVDETYQSAIEEMEASGMSAAALGISEEGFKRIAGIEYYFENLSELVTQEGNSLYLDPEQYGNYYAEENETEEESQTDQESEKETESQTNFDFENTDWSDEENLSEEALIVREQIAQSYLSEYFTAEAEEASVEYDDDIETVIPGEFYEEYYGEYLKALIQAENETE